MSRDNKASLNSRHGAHNRTQQHERGLFLSFTVCMVWVVGIGLLLSLVTCRPASAKPIASDDNSSYYIDLSKTISGLPSRHALAFFVPNICLASQAKHDTSTTPIYPPRGETVYDGVTSQNTIAFGRICGAVTNSTESEPRHPIQIASNRTYSVTPTQKLLGAIHHG